APAEPVLPPVSTEKAKPANEPGAACPKLEASRLLSAYFAIPDGDKGRANHDAIHQALVSQDVSVQFLVATVPEPRLGFDGTVESITRALEATGFLLDRYLLPWNPQADKRSGESSCSQDQPGVALFHRAATASGHGGSRRGLLLLYLVGESPIAGIHKPAFISAIDDLLRIRALVPDGRCESCNEVRMVGPAFSGAVVSLDQILAHFPSLSFRMLSGRATSGAIRDQIQKWNDGMRSVRYQATVIPDEALQTEFFCFLTETLGADEHDVALISESSTGYGQAVIAAQASQSQGLPPGYDRVFPAHKTHKSNHCKRAHRPRLTLPVPLHIARLHTVDVAKTSPSTPRSSEPLLPDLVPSPVSRPLPTLLDDSPRTDIIPTLSPRTVSAAERSLAHILSTIYAEKIRYVGILATDVQDKLFLARQIRAYSPDVVLFTFESDILYTHPEARSYLKGMLVVSPYPLFTRNQQWSYPFRGLRQRIQFASDADQGVYNATVALLGYPEQLVEYSQAAPGVDKPLSRPAIWVSAVGNDTLFPLAFIKDYDAGGYVYENPSIHRGQFEYRYSPYQQGTLSFVMVLIGIFGLWLCAGYFVHYYFPDVTPPILLSPLKIFRRSSIVRSLLDDELAARESNRQPIFMLCLFVPAWVGYFVLTTTHFMQLRDGNLDELLDEKRLSLWLRFWYHSGHIGVYQNLSWKVLCIALFGVVAQLAYSAALLDAMLLYLLPGWRSKLHDRFVAKWQGLGSRWRRFWLTVVGLGVAGLLLLGFFLFVAFVNYLQVDFNHLLFLRRSAQPAFGLSPLMPLLLLGLGVQLYGYCELQRIRLLEKLATVYLDLLEELEDDRGLRGKISEIAAYLGSPSVWQILAGFLLALFQAVTVLSELVTLEVAPMHLVFRFLIALQVTMIGFVFYRFLRLWSVFREFLHQLGHHPLAQSLERLPHKFIRSLGALFLEDLPELTRRQAAQEHFRLLINHMNQLDFDRDLLPLTTVTDIEKVKSLLQDLRELVPHIERETMQQGAATDVPEAQVVHASRILTQILKRFWRARPLPGSLVAGRPGEAQLSVRPGPEQNTAEVYQRLLPDTLHLWLRLAEDFLAIQVVTYINRLFPHLRNGLLNVTIGFVLLLLALIVYPFQPQRYLVLLSTVLLVMTVPTTMYVLAQMNRDEVLSRIAKSQPGKLTWDRAFISQIVIYGVLPLLSLIATQFPEVRGAAFSWLETALKTLK
ncbi:MAG TPA: hypothetical protein PKL17_08335, partial [Pseudomonadota bacterium]|nr:hypothetical protein [Pseudomonadota bacterium]